MKFDLHTHHERCGHAVGSIQAYIEEGIKKDLKIIGISDHSPYFFSKEDHFIPQIAMGKNEFSNYIAEVLELKKKYANQIEVLLGVESDFFPQHIDLYRKNYQQYPFDYIIGSVHFSPVSEGPLDRSELFSSSIFNADRWDLQNEEEMNKEKDRYYMMIEQSARCGLFNILGHIDCMKASFPKFSELDFTPVEKALKVIAESEVVIEVNTSAKLKDCGRWFPSDEILERAFYYGVKVTFGSDAHEPNRVADEWTIVKKKLQEIGYKEWAIFRKRQRHMVQI